MATARRCALRTGHAGEHLWVTTTTPTPQPGECHARPNPHAVALGLKGGRAKSASKTDSSRLNGRKGGRPRRVKPTGDA